MDPTPLTVKNVVWFGTITLFLYLLFGYVVASLLQRVLSKEKNVALPLHFYNFSLLSLLTLYLGLGMIGLTVVLTSLLFLPGPFSWKVLCTILFFSTLFIYLFHKNLKHSNLNLIQKIKAIDRKKAFLTVITVTLLLYAIYHYLLPAIGLYAYPGHDGVLLALYSSLIKENGKLLFLCFQYPYARGSRLWGFQAMPAVAAFFTVVYQTSIAKTHLFFFQFNRGLTPIFVYAFVELLLQKESSLMRRVCGICSMLGAIFASAQYLYFIFGGIGESMGNNISLTLFICYILLNFKMKEENVSRMEKIWIYGFFFIFSLVIVVYSSWRVLPLYVSGIGACLVVELILKEKEGKMRGGVFIGVISAIYLSLYIISLFNCSSFLVSNLTRFTSLPQYERERLIFLKNGSISLYYHRFLQFFRHLHGRYFLFRLILGITSLALFSRKKRDINKWVPILMGVFLFLLSQNHPNTLYFLPYPTVTRMNPFRIYYLCFIPLAMGTGIGVGLAVMHSILILKQVGKTLFLKLKGKTHTRLSLPSFEGILALFLLLSFLICPWLQQAGKLYQHRMFYLGRKKVQPLTKADMQSFQWMQENLSQKRRFFVNFHGSGAWIPIYTDHITLPPRTLDQGSPNTTKFNFLLSHLRTGNLSELVIQRLKAFHINYVYIGRQLSPWSPKKFNHTALTQHQLFTCELEKGEVRVYRFLSEEKDLLEST